LNKKNSVEKMQTHGRPTRAQKSQQKNTVQRDTFARRMDLHLGRRKTFSKTETLGENKKTCFVGHTDYMVPTRDTQDTSITFEGEAHCNLAHVLGNTF